VAAVRQIRARTLSATGWTRRRPRGASAYLQQRLARADNPGPPKEETMRGVLLLAAVVLALATGCSGRKPEATKELTEHQRDSVLAQSVLPGAGAVGHAMSAADREARRAASMDAQVDSLSR
jgi:hypothetical protein